MGPALPKKSSLILFFSIANLKEALQAPCERFSKSSPTFFQWITNRTFINYLIYILHINSFTVKFYGGMRNITMPQRYFIRTFEINIPLTVLTVPWHDSALSRRMRTNWAKNQIAQHIWTAFCEITCNMPNVLTARGTHERDIIQLSTSTNYRLLSFNPPNLSTAINWMNELQILFQA